MKTTNEQLKFFINLGQAYARIMRVFDSRLIGGIGYNELVILYHLSNSPEEQMRRVDLAEKVGLTPSGVTRLLLPMEKLGMIERAASERDGRVSFVKMAKGGKRILEETLEKAEELAEDMLPSTKLDQVKKIGDVFNLFALNRIG